MLGLIDGSINLNLVLPGAWGCLGLLRVSLRHCARAFGSEAHHLRRVRFALVGTGACHVFIFFCEIAISVRFLLLLQSVRFNRAIRLLLIR